MAGTSKPKPTEEIILIRGKAGLGFNIRGGTDIQHIKSNNGIFVTKIRDKGAAAEDGRLKEGDQIIEINRTNVAAVTHTTAVNLFLSSGDKVQLKVIPGEEQRIKADLARAEIQRRTNSTELQSIKDDSSSSSSGLYKVSVLVIGLGLVAGAAFVGYKYVKQRS